jgi:hypothetical protein
MDDLLKFEIELEKLSSLFFNSLNELQKFAPLTNLENEDNMENSKQNLDRMKIEKIENYSENKEAYPKLIADKSKEINESFDKIHSVLESLKTKDEYKKTDEELNKNLRDLKEWNELKTRTINDKIKHIEEVINRVKTDNDINTQLNMRYNQNFNMDFFDS